MKKLLIFGLSFCFLFVAEAQKNKTPEPAKSLINSGAVSGLKFRNVGPAVTSGRVVDFAVNPNNTYEYYVAAASGGVWKTTDNGTNYSPIFDSQGSYSIGCITLDPQKSSTVWVGTGENNGQRSIAYGDGVYKSEDGGNSWKNMGLKNSEHIGNIVVHPNNSDVVYVAVQGPLWSAGGDRGLYKTTNGGESWERILDISENTGVSMVLLDPRNPSIMYASTWQRRRHVFTFIAGGPESAIHKSTDGGKTWKKLTSGLPTGDVGRIGLAISPVNPDYIYAIIEAAEDNGGFYRSTNMGASFSKMSKFSTSGNYYQRIIADPVNLDRVYSMDTYSKVTHDGGKTFVPFGDKNKHVDHHAIWIDPNNNSHYMIGCDGGIYTTYSDGQSWNFHANLPITQFYKVALDNASPFYNIYGGTQDNFSLGGPSRTTNAAGIVNDDWFVTNGGDGFESQVDPENSNIIYAQAQHGWLVRYDKKSGQSLFIQPQPGKDEAAYRWNWDAPLLISPHSNTRLYFAANKLFRSDDRGNTWKTISGDLSRQLDRNKIPVMGKVWSMDAVAKNASTTIYGNIVALDESPKQENLLYVGTDDGLVHISENGGDSWTKIESFTGVPANTYVNMLLASVNDANVVYAAFNNHKKGDFKPYIFKSKDKGKTWQSIASNLPDRGSVYSIAEDHVNPNLLFAGTEFGVFFTIDGGLKWTQLKAGLPTIAIRDIAIHRRENDLVLASFGRGFYVLDDYTPLRAISESALAKEAHLFDIKKGLMYIESMPLGLRGKSFQGDAYYTAENPPMGAVFTYYLKESIKTEKEKRQEAEAKLIEAGKDVFYPTIEQMRVEDTEEKPYLIFTIANAAGKVIRKLKSDASSGVKRITWDFRYPSTSPISLAPQDLSNPFAGEDVGYLALPGKYSVTMGKVINGTYTELVGPQPFEIQLLDNVELPAKDRVAVEQFMDKVSELSRVVDATGTVHRELMTTIKHLKVAVRETPDADFKLLKAIDAVESRLQKAQIELYGDRTLERREFETKPSIANRVGMIVYSLWSVTTEPTTTQKSDYEIAAEAFEPVWNEIKQISQVDLPAIEAQLEEKGAPYTPKRKLDWER
jgi:photosystem II stability/assembly factor-like uncharacterized protein